MNTLRIPLDDEAEDAWMNHLHPQAEKMEATERVLYDPNQPRGKGDQGGQWVPAAGGGAEEEEEEQGLQPDPELKKKAEDGVAKAIAERPGRATHGHTGKNAFYIDREGNILPYDKVGWDYKGGELIAVHSHSADSRSPTNTDAEDFQPLNAGDFAIFVKQAKVGLVRADAIIMADGRMEMIEITPETKLAFFKLGAKKLESKLHRSYDERSNYYEANKDKPGYEHYQQERELLRSFCKEYGLDYHENMNWKRGGLLG